MAAACASSALNAPRMNRPRMMMPGMTRKATTQGIASSSANSMARFCAERAPAWSPAATRLRHLRHQHGADRNADHADRQLVDAVGVIERRQRAGGEEARDDGVGEQRQLRAGRADRRRHERLEEAPHVVVPGAARETTSSHRRASASPPTRAACSTPEISTPQAAAWPALGNSHATASVAIIAH